MTQEHLEALARGRAKASENRKQKAQEAAAGPQKARAARVPAEDPEAVTNRLVDRALGVDQPPPPKPRPQYVDPGNDPDMQAERQSLEILQATERAAADARAARRQNSRSRVQDQPQGRIPVEVMALRQAFQDGIVPDHMPDPMAMEDDDGTPLLKAGYCGRWVRVRDDFDQKAENTLRLRRMRAWGAEPIMKKDGQPLRTETLVAMQLPIKQNALRKIQASASGALDSAKQIDNLYDEADRVNSEFSRRHHGASSGVVRIEPLADTGRQYGDVRPFAAAED